MKISIQAQLFAVSCTMIAFIITSELIVLITHSFA